MSSRHHHPTSAAPLAPHPSTTSAITRRRPHLPPLRLRLHRGVQPPTSPRSSSTSRSSHPIRLPPNSRHHPVRWIFASTTAPTATTTISVRDKLPDATLTYFDLAGERQTVTVSELTKGKKTVPFTAPSPSIPPPPSAPTPQLPPPPPSPPQHRPPQALFPPLPIPHRKKQNRGKKREKKIVRKKEKKNEKKERKKGKERKFLSFLLHGEEPLVPSPIGAGPTRPLLPPPLHRLSDAHRCRRCPSAAHLSASAGARHCAPLPLPPSFSTKVETAARPSAFPLLGRLGAIASLRHLRAIASLRCLRHTTPRGSLARRLCLSPDFLVDSASLFSNKSSSATHPRHHHHRSSSERLWSSASQ